MKPALIALAACVILMFSLVRAQTTQPDKPKLSGPYTHANLTVYFLHGPDTITGDYLTLEEAMRDKKVIVHETGSVNELTVQNVSNQPVYIQSGEIVKGGKQDRTLGNDLVLAPKSAKVPIAAFCVEHGRWTQRGGESTVAFGSSTDAVAGNKMKLAANTAYKDGGGQQKVWDEAASNQAKLAQRVEAPVAAAASPSSFQLTLENKNVQAEVEKYIAKLKSAGDKEDDVIGYVVAINGKVSCSDSYGSSKLFRKLWPKLLKSAAVEAAAEYKADAKITEPTAEQVESALANAAVGKKTHTKINDRLDVAACDADDSVMFETRDLTTSTAAKPDGYLHRSYLRKD